MDVPSWKISYTKNENYHFEVPSINLWIIFLFIIQRFICSILYWDTAAPLEELMLTLTVCNVHDNLPCTVIVWLNLTIKGTRKFLFKTCNSSQQFATVTFCDLVTYYKNHFGCRWIYMYNVTHLINVNSLDTKRIWIWYVMIHVHTFTNLYIK